MKTIANKHHFTLGTAIFCLITGVAGPVAAHVVLDQPSAAAGSSTKAALRVSHGCEGAPTTGVAVQVPAGFQGAKPQPKAGWTLAVRREKLATPYTSHGKTVTEDVVDIRWTAASREAALPDGQFDEFVLMGHLPDAAGPLWFKVLQTCETGQNDWSQVPAAGTSTKGLKSPAALLEVLPAVPAPHAH
jgi:hypothetical protein